ncbi:hypothetical protein B7P43_G07035 [Cryptotermes secundus]|uniref:Uncharacterized protein n=1 Tax=Cryptotermes secundus TaxID=105785 RepID=A0A2J7RDP7_9NEOP|nr:hypothetical protein B7P43_G07035 [Cryptotermes secundus]
MSHEIVHTSNYCAITNMHTLQTPQHPLSLFSALCIFISLSVATAFNSGDSSASRAQVLSSQSPVQNSRSTDI